MFSYFSNSCMLQASSKVKYTLLLHNCPRNSEAMNISISQKKTLLKRTFRVFVTLLCKFDSVFHGPGRSKYGYRCFLWPGYGIKLQMSHVEPSESNVHRLAAWSSKVWLLYGRTPNSWVILPYKFVLQIHQIFLRLDLIIVWPTTAVTADMQNVPSKPSAARIILW